MKKLNKNIKGYLYVPVTDEAEKKIGSVDKLEAILIKNAIVLMKKEMTAIEVIEIIEGLKGVVEELFYNLADACGTCDDCECYEELEDALNIKLPDFLLKEAGISQDAKLCACTDEDSGEVTVMEAEYKHDLSDVPKGMIKILKSMGVCLKELNKCLMSEKTVYGNEVTGGNHE